MSVLVNGLNSCVYGEISWEAAAAELSQGMLVRGVIFDGAFGMGT